MDATPRTLPSIPRPRSHVVLRRLRSPGQLTISLLLAVWPIVGGATTYLIRPDGSGDFSTIQGALDAVLDGDEILLANGTFTGESNLDFHGRAVVLRAESGDPRSCIIHPEDRGFYFHSGETRQTRVQDITILNGWDHDYGGGAYLYNASPTFRNCRFDNCCSYNGNGIYVAGGSPLLQNCEFACSCAIVPSGEGGAIYADYCALEIENCIFHSLGHPHGGAIYAWHSNLTITGSSFNGIIGIYEGFYFQGGTASFTSCTIAGVFADTVFRLEGALLVADHSIFAYDYDQATSVVCGSSGSAQFTCCDVFGFSGGDWIDCLAGQLEMNGNLHADPLLCSYSKLTPNQADRFPCDMPMLDLRLRSDSPCAAENNPDCGLIGALDVGCMGPVPVEVTSWGRIKSRYLR